MTETRGEAIKRLKEEGQIRAAVRTLTSYKDPAADEIRLCVVRAEKTSFYWAGHTGSNRKPFFKTGQRIKKGDPFCYCTDMYPDLLSAEEEKVFTKIYHGSPGIVVVLPEDRCTEEGGIIMAVLSDKDG